MCDGNWAASVFTIMCETPVEGGTASNYRNCGDAMCRSETKRKWRTHRVALVVVRHKGRVIHFDNRVPGIVDIRQLRLGRVCLGDPVDITCSTARFESTYRCTMGGRSTHHSLSCRRSRKNPIRKRNSTRSTRARDCMRRAHVARGSRVQLQGGRPDASVYQSRKAVASS